MCFLRVTVTKQKELVKKNREINKSNLLLIMNKQETLDATE